jgi:hypothetical protein
MWRATIRGGAVEFTTPAVALNFAKFKREHEGAKIVIEEEKPERSLSELRMYRAWLRNVAEHSGNDEDKLHEFLIDRCAPVAVIAIKGKKGQVEIERKKRTSGGTSLTMDKQEMAEFMRKCAALTGYPLPTEEELRAMGYEPSTQAPVKTALQSKVPYPKEDNNLADKF